jgi:hypothetical protein
MKYLKLYEDFFSFFQYDKLSDKDTEKIFGLTREDIELRLLDVTDDVEGIHVSVNFDVDGAFLDSNEIDIKTDENGQSSWRWTIPDDDYRPVDKINIQIHFYLTHELLNSIKDDSKSWVTSKGRSEYDITPILNRIKSVVEKNKIKEHFEQLGWVVKVVEKQSADMIQTSVSGLSVGRTVYSLFLKKKLL